MFSIITMSKIILKSHPILFIKSNPNVTLNDPGEFPLLWNLRVNRLMWGIDMIS